MNINELTIGQVKELAAIFGANTFASPQTAIGSQFIDRKVIIRTVSAGVWFGILSEKSGNEVILTSARRMWRWWAAEGISLSDVANVGINRDKSKIVSAVDSVWLEAIEIIPVTDAANKSIGGAPDAKVE